MSKGRARGVSNGYGVRRRRDGRRPNESTATRSTAYQVTTTTSSTSRGAARVGGATSARCGRTVSVSSPASSRASSTATAPAPADASAARITFTTSARVSVSTPGTESTETWTLRRRPFKSTGFFWQRVYLESRTSAHAITVRLDSGLSRLYACFN
jgi:hypothetical protein